MLPVVLVHGFCGFGALRLLGKEVRYFGGIERAIADRGHAVTATTCHPVASIAHRAEQLREQLLKWLGEIGRPDGRVILVTHSMGGLDSRYMISKLGMAGHVAALLTIATPHRGTPQADFWAENVAAQRVALPLMDLLGVNAKGVFDLTTAGMEKFNEQVHDHPEVRYFSISTACPAARVPIVLQPGYWIIRNKEGENDAVVSAASAVWGQHLGTWPVHHMLAVDHRFPEDVLNPVKSVVPMYLTALDQMAEAGVAGLTAAPAPALDRDPAPR
jgi:triacylglycerol lipase